MAKHTTPVVFEHGNMTIKIGGQTLQSVKPLVEIPRTPLPYYGCVVGQNAYYEALEARLTALGVSAEQLAVLRRAAEKSTLFGKDYAGFFRNIEALLNSGTPIERVMDRLDA